MTQATFSIVTGASGGINRGTNTISYIAGLVKK